MSDVVINVVESATNVNVTEPTVEVDVTETVVEVSASTAGLQGASYNQGDPIYVTVRNATGAILTKGTIVYTSGAQGNHTLVQKALASGDATSARTLGWVSANIANNADGLVMVEGYLDGIDTDHIAEGSQLYLSGTTAGSFQATKPQAPIHLVYVGVVTKSNPGNGRVLVKVQNGYELGELHDVKITSPANNDVLTYDSATDLWINKVNAADGVTSITAASPLTGGTITSTGTIGLDQTALSITQSQVTNLVSDLADKANLAGGNAITGAQTITSTAIGQVPLTLVGASGQTANLLSTAGGARIPAAGNYFIAPGITSTFVADFNAGNATTTPVTIKAFASQTASVLALQNSAGSITANFTAPVNNVNRLNLGGTDLSATFGITVHASGGVGQVIRAAASQSANIQEWQDSAGTILTRISPVGQVVSNSQAFFGSGAASIPNTRLNVATGSASVVGQVIRGASGQTADLLQIQDNAGTSYLSVNNVGSLLFGTNSGSFLSGANGRVNVQLSGDNIGVTVRAFASQTADLLQLQTSAGSYAGGFERAGALNIQPAAALNGYSLMARAAGASVVPVMVRGAASQSADYLQVQNSAGAVVAKVDSVGDITARVLRSQLAARIATNDVNVAPMVSSTIAGQVSNNTEWQNDTGVVASVSASGLIRATGGFRTIGAGTIEDVNGIAPYLWLRAGTIEVNSRSTTFIPLTIKGVSAQTADLFLIQNNGGTTQFRVDPNGMTIANSLGVAGSPSGISYAYFTTPSASAKPVVIRGAASQTANLLEIQNSAGSILAFVRNDGVVRAPFLSTSTNYLFVGEQNGGGYLAMTKQTAAISNIGADRAGIYFRDGTVPGTLKLVVRAGAAGAETTILDNIPQ